MQNPTWVRGEHQGVRCRSCPPSPASHLASIGPPCLCRTATAVLACPRRVVPRCLASVPHLACPRCLTFSEPCLPVLCRSASPRLPTPRRSVPPRLPSRSMSALDPVKGRLERASGGGLAPLGVGACMRGEETAG